MPLIKKSAEADVAQSIEGRGAKARAVLRAQLGDDIYSSWFNAMEFDGFDGRVVKVSVPVKFLRTWILSHYSDQLLSACKAEFKTAERVEVLWRQPGNAAARPAEAARADATEAPAATAGEEVRDGETAKAAPVLVRPVPSAVRTSAGGLEGSPLDPRYTFESFVIGASNRMSHAGAIQVAETVLSDQPSFNPLYIHSAVGLGKTQSAARHRVGSEAPRAACAGAVSHRRAFRYQFVEALRSSDPLASRSGSATSTCCSSTIWSSCTEKRPSRSSITSSMRC